MTNLFVFEDNESSVLQIELALMDTPHEITGKARSLRHAQQLICELMEGNIKADILLLDANLDYDRTPPDFRYTPPANPGITAQKGLFGRRKAPAPTEIVVPYDRASTRIGADGRMIKKILGACDIYLPTIGISSDDMEYYGIDVDVYIGKHDFGRQLVPAIDQLLATNGQTSEDQL